MERESKQPAVPVRREGRFVLATVVVAVVCVVLAFWFAAPLHAGQTASAEPLPFAQAAQVDLNTADLDALCTLPNVGQSRAAAIIEYRAAHGRFASVNEAADVPGLTQAIVDSWEELAYVS